MRGIKNGVIAAAAAVIMMAGLTGCGAARTAENAAAEGTASMEAPSTDEPASMEEAPSVESMIRTETQTQEAESTETESETAEEEAEEFAVEGMVLSSGRNNLSIMTPEGEILYLACRENEVRIELEDGILPGEVVQVTYTGSMEEGTAEAVGIEAGTTETALDREAYEFAITAVEYAKSNDLEGLSGLASYPVYIGIGEIGVTAESAGDFNSIEREELIPLGELAGFNLFQLSETKAGIVIGDGKPNIIFTAGENGYEITGINVK